ncbi:hypothetical protein GGI04_000533 [Coemansia thaxteri]|nr:hypothetical protein GGI04_000533 [Coemansia thaxteri]KAJ2474088.1 hypothetical protein GGI02_000360 [Coemansia sp. RSA 2322]KAJ2482754.1 hypothetical protein EV174_003133 [Coemansia sp. RSA 2320]
MSHVPNYEDKYRAKLQQRAREQGCASIADLKQKQTREIRQQDSQTAVPQGAADTGGRARSSSNLPPTVKTLDQIMRVERLAGLSAEEVGAVWAAYHASKAGTVAAAIPAATYRQLLATARENPVFVLPVPRDGQGVEFFLLQFDYHQVHFTPLAEYKAHGVHARSVLTLTHYTDLLDRGVVLMRGELDPANRSFGVQNAQLLAQLLQVFYVTGGPAKRALLETFNHRPAEFDYAQVIEAAQTL